MRILLVEDDESCARLFRVICELEGHEVLSAYDGERGLQLLREERVDLVLLDIVMTGLDGLAVLKAMKRHPLTRQLPVVVHTADVSEANRRAIGALAPAGVLYKPFKRRELLEAIAQATEGQPRRLGCG